MANTDPFKGSIDPLFSNRYFTDVNSYFRRGATAATATTTTTTTWNDTTVVAPLAPSTVTVGSNGVAHLLNNNVTASSHGRVDYDDKVNVQHASALPRLGSSTPVLQQQMTGGSHGEDGRPASFTQESGWQNYSNSRSNLRGASHSGLLNPDQTHDDYHAHHDAFTINLQTQALHYYEWNRHADTMMWPQVSQESKAGTVDLYRSYMSSCLRPLSPVNDHDELTNTMFPQLMHPGGGNTALATIPETRETNFDVPLDDLLPLLHPNVESEADAQFHFDAEPPAMVRAREDDTYESTFGGNRGGGNSVSDTYFARVTDETSGPNSSDSSEDQKDERIAAATPELPAAILTEEVTNSGHDLHRTNRRHLAEDTQVHFNDYVYHSNIDLKTKAVCFGWIKHPGTKMWRSLIQEFSCKPDVSWTDEIGKRVYEGLQQEGFVELYVRVVIVKQSPASKKPKHSRNDDQNDKKDDRAEGTNLWRKASYEEFMSKTKDRFNEDRKPRSKTSSKRPRGRPSSPSSDSEPAPQWVREPWDPVKKKNVCLESQHHFGAIRWQEMVQTFSDNLQRYPKWTDEIADLVKGNLAEDDFAPILVFRDPYGRPCKSFHGGLWVLALKKEIIEITRDQFLRNRKLLKNPPNLKAQEGTEGQPPNSGGHHEHRGSPGDEAASDDSSTCAQLGDSPSNSNFGGGGSTRHVCQNMQQQMMVGADCSDFTSSENDIDEKASDTTSDVEESDVSDEDEFGEAEIIWVYEHEDDDEEDDEDDDQEDKGQRVTVSSYSSTSKGPKSAPRLTSNLEQTLSSQNQSNDRIRGAPLSCKAKSVQGETAMEIKVPECASAQEIPGKSECVGHDVQIGRRRTKPRIDHASAPLAPVTHAAE